MYISVLRPTLEYASVAWVICAKHDKERLRKKTVELLEVSLILQDDLSTQSTSRNRMTYDKT